LGRGKGVKPWVEGITKIKVHGPITKCSPDLGKDLPEIRTPLARGELSYTKCLGSCYFSHALLLGLYPTRNAAQNWRKPGKQGGGHYEKRNALPPPG